METLCYFYHSDHPDYLDSTSWVTDSAKNGVQYCEYLPFGEPLVDQRSTTWSSRYTFSGKERDSETGYSYFGARYYHSDLSIWLSVDPMSDKYPNFTPYAYCANNPIILVDPDGRDWFENELTGDIYYNRDFKKGDIDKIDGVGWKWKGKNGMFGKTDNDVLNSNISLASDWKVENSRESSITQAIFEGEAAEKFMNKMEYKLVSTQVLEYSTSIPSMITSGTRVIRADIGGTITFPEKIGYISNDYSLISKNIIASSTYSNLGITTTICRKALTYDRQSSAIPFLLKIGDFFKSGLTSNFDLRGTGPCIPEQKYIDQFLKQYGKR